MDKNNILNDLEKKDNKFINEYLKIENNPDFDPKQKPEIEKELREKLDLPRTPIYTGLK